MSANRSSAVDASNGKICWRVVALLLAILAFLFSSSFKPGQAIFANDGPLAALLAEPMQLPAGFTGIWQDLNWVGAHGGSAVPNMTFLLLWLLKPILFAKFYDPFTLLFFGISVFVFCRQLRFRPIVCLLTATAAMLNMDIFSNVCWGLGTRAVTIGAAFFALAAIVSGMRRQAWLKFPLAGLCVGLAVTEGADVGMILSFCVAAFTVVAALCAEGSPAKNLAKGVVRTTVVAAFAGLMAYQAITALLGAGVVSAVTTAQQTRTAQENWDFATQWSLPKIETARVIIPGLFGYRMDTPQGGQYWGAVGRSPAYDTTGQGYPRYSGSGEYAGVLVTLIAIWALAASFRRDGDTFSGAERKLIWFWAVVAVVSLLFAFGRYALFYRLIYPLPFFKTIRNPIKFMHPFHLALLILFAYGLQGLARRYLEGVGAKTLSMTAQLKSWWAKATSFEKKWTFGSLGVVGLSLLGYLIFAKSTGALLEHLTRTGFDASQAAAITKFCQGEIGLYLLFLTVSVALVIVIMSGAFAGGRAKWAGALLGLILVVDLSRANAPWIKYYDYHEKLATNPIIETLRDKPYEHRVAILRFNGGAEMGFLQQLYQVEWLQHHFQAYNIQSYDFPQEPREAPENAAFRLATATNMVRSWQLTNTRFLLGLAGFVEPMNEKLDGEKRRFKANTLFTFVRGPVGDSILVQTNTTGPFALIEFGGALPRAKLYSQWQVNTNDQGTLDQLGSASFDPAQLVMVAADSSSPPPAVAAAQNAGSVEITHYATKRIQLIAQAQTPAVLLLNDKYDPNWRVRVDGQPTPLLRCNYLMRGVYLTPGTHTVVFEFAPPRTTLFVTLAALALGALICGILFATRGAPEEGTVARATKPATPAAAPKP